MAFPRGEQIPWEDHMRLCYYPHLINFVENYISVQCLKTPIFRYCTLCLFVIPLPSEKVANITVISLVMTTVL